jgi:hypothetical protein
MKAQFSHVHWGRVLLTSVLVVILAFILNTVLLLLASYLWGPLPRTVVVYQVTSSSTSILAILLTGGGGVWVARNVEREAPLHGFLAGLAAALILFIFNPDLTNFLQGAYRGRLDLLARALGTFFLMVAAGWLGAVLVSRRREK